MEQRKMASSSSKKRIKTPFSKLKATEQGKLDSETVREMSKCLNKLTTSGKSSLDDTEIKRFKRMCRKSDDYVRYAFFLIMEQMEKKHAEIRLSAFQVAYEIFSRSHAFREILINHLQDFLTLTTGTETNEPLPPPKIAANRLKEETLSAMQKWYDSYGKSYRKLDVGYNYLQNCKHVDFQNIWAQNEAERMKAEQEEKRKQKQMAERLAKVLKEIEESQLDIEECVKEADNCLSLLLPSPDDFGFFTLGNGQELLSPDDLTDSKKQKIDSSKDNNHENEQMSKKDGKSGNFNLKVESTENKDRTEVLYDPSDKKKENSESRKNSQSTSDSSKIEINNGKREENESIASTHAGFQNRKDQDSLDRSTKDDAKMDHEEEHDGEEVEEFDDDDGDNNSNRAHGFWKPGYCLQIELPVEEISVTETDDNTDVLQSLRDVAKLTNNSFLPRVIKWLEVLGKNGAKQEDMKKIIDLKQSLEVVKSKCLELKLVSSENLTEDQDSDEDDLEDVPEKEGYEATVPSNLGEDQKLSTQNFDKKEDQNLQLKRHCRSDFPSSSGDADTPLKKIKSVGLYWNLKERETPESLEDPTSRAAAIARAHSIQESSGFKDSASQLSPSKAEQTKDVPFVEFGKDLEYWENPNQMEAPSIIKFDSLHRFWASGDTETETASQNDISLMLNRTFKFTGQFEPVKWSCRAPLPSGKLCPRMDRVKCPFHGPIIARDNYGNPAVKNELPALAACTSTSGATTTGETNSELAPWQDPVLQREIEQATGHDLGSARSEKLLEKASNKGKGKGKGKGKRKGKGKSPKKSGLTDIKAALNTTRQRLEKKIFNKRSMRRVCSNLDSADFRRVRDKFGNQFNYSLH